MISELRPCNLQLGGHIQSFKIYPPISNTTKIIKFYLTQILILHRLLHPSPHSILQQGIVVRRRGVSVVDQEFTSLQPGIADQGVGIFGGLDVFIKGQQ